MQDIFSFFRSPSLLRISMPKLSKRSTNKTARRELFWNFCLENRTISSMETDFLFGLDIFLNVTI